MLQAIGQNVIVELITQSEQFRQDLQKRTGLFLPEKMLEGQPNTGTVYSIGDEVKDHEYQIGDVVIFAKQDIFDGFRHDEKSLVNLKADEIVATIPQPK